MSPTSEHIHSEKLDMNAGQFFLNTKFSQNCVLKFDASERTSVDAFEADHICTVDAMETTINAKFE